LLSLSGPISSWSSQTQRHLACIVPTFLAYTGRYSPCLRCLFTPVQTPLRRTPTNRAGPRLRCRATPIWSGSNPDIPFLRCLVRVPPCSCLTLRHRAQPRPTTPALLHHDRHYLSVPQLTMPAFPVRVGQYIYMPLLACISCSRPASFIPGTTTPFLACIVLPLLYSHQLTMTHHAHNLFIELRRMFPNPYRNSFYCQACLHLTLFVFQLGIISCICRLR
jgi:hypothetical protein